jgi:hypothetical protein
MIASSISTRRNTASTELHNSVVDIRNSWSENERRRRRASAITRQAKLLRSLEVRLMDEKI